jgi:hypothetical protein
MNVKRPLLIIIPILLLFLLIFFICSDRDSLFKDDNSISSISDSDGIGYMREITPGEETDDSTGESYSSEGISETPASESDKRKISTGRESKTYGKSIEKDKPAGVKPSADRGIVQAKKETITGKTRAADRETATRKDDSVVKDNKSEDERTASAIAENKKNADKEVSAAESSDTDGVIIDDKSISSEEKDIAEKTESAEKSDAGRGVGERDISIAEEKIETGDSKNEAVISGDKSEAAEVTADKPGSKETVYSRLDRIYLYTGEVLTGTVTARGDVYTIVTPEGIRKIAAHDIQSNDIVK